MPQNRLDATFSALADPTRRAILARLISGEASVAELAKPFAMSQPAISKHLKVLENAGLISRGRDAQKRPCRIEGKPLAEATDGWNVTARFGKATICASTPCWMNCNLKRNHNKPGGSPDEAQRNIETFNRLRP